MGNGAILLLSGGIDSTTVLARLASEGRDITALVFDYNQTLRREIEVAVENAKRYGADVRVRYLPMNGLPGSCAIVGDHTDGIAMGRSLDEIADGTPSSYVPFRNGLLLAYAVAYGEAADVQDIYCGGNGLYSGNYWDDTLAFADAFTAAARIGTSPRYRPQIHYPLALMDKPDVVAKGLELGVDYALTWSCYLNGREHCGQCDSCVQRGRALEAHGIGLDGRAM